MGKSLSADDLPHTAAGWLKPTSVSKHKTGVIRQTQILGDVDPILKKILLFNDILYNNDMHKKKVV